MVFSSLIPFIFRKIKSPETTLQHFSSLRKREIVKQFVRERQIIELLSVVKTRLHICVSGDALKWNWLTRLNPGFLSYRGVLSTTMSIPGKCPRQFLPISFQGGWE